MVFSWPLYEERGLRPKGEGIWYYESGTRPPRPLTSSEHVAMVPLALSPKGDSVVVWWNPLEPRDDEDEKPACDQGIYLLSTTGLGSRLLVSEDWSWYDANDVEWTYSIPAAALSADGRWLALIEWDRIRILALDRDEPPTEHIGVCPNWAWTSTRSNFVAGCDDMTTRWFWSPTANAEGSHALPFPFQEFGCGGDHPGARGIGFARDGIRVVRFFGNPAGACEGGVFKYAATTFDGESAMGTIQSGRFAFITAGYWVADRWERISNLDTTGVRLSSDASWAYVRNAYPGKDRVLRLESGETTPVKRIGDPVRTPAGSKLLFGLRPDEERGLYAVWSVNAAGTRREVATIGWPDGVEPPEWWASQQYGSYQRELGVQLLPS